MVSRIQANQFLLQAITDWCVLFGGGKNHRNGIVGDHRWQIRRLLLYRDVGLDDPWIWHDCGYIFRLLPWITLSVYWQNGSKFGYSIRHWIKVNHIESFVVFLKFSTATNKVPNTFKCRSLTRSSATMPVTIQVLDNMGIDSRVTRFVIPVGKCLAVLCPHFIGSALALCKYCGFVSRCNGEHGRHRSLWR